MAINQNWFYQISTGSEANQASMVTQAVTQRTLLDLSLQQQQQQLNAISME